MGTPSVNSAHLGQHVERLSEIKTHGSAIEARVTNQPFQKIALLGGRMVGTDIDPDIVPRRGRRLPRKSGRGGNALAALESAPRGKLRNVRPSNAEKVLSDALELTAQDRAKLAAALLASLDEGEDDDAGQAWAAEIERRAERVLSGGSQGAPWETVRERLLARLRRD
ncbi:MAG: addiction module protein [Myxococcales bacterium]|nr:addiction module protein [Myxococcales bacterium]